MEQESGHAIPQDVTSYEFRLVGDMTLRQFFQIAGGALVALLFYASPLPGIVKWPVILLSGLLGAAFAFLPLEERPLAVWFISFIRAIYSPTKLVWKKGWKQEAFAPETEGVAPEVTVIPTQGKTTEEYLSTTAQSEGHILSSFEAKERSFFLRTFDLFHLAKPQEPQATAEATIVQPPQFVVEQVPAPTSAGPVQKTVAQPQPETATPVTVQTIPVSPIFPQKRGPGRPRLTAPRFEIAATPPPAPSVPNIVVGQVLDSEGKVVEAAILEIKDSEGRPVRALRTNKVGHFLTATPLIPGTYELIIEKEGLIFDPMQIVVSNEIIPPLGIQAKQSQN
ncbi:PrgI family protein [Candidatus Microgenomates bacterium]|nr:PrgI family protein [Candidatus Microgenomates bacterium]